MIVENLVFLKKEYDGYISSAVSKKNYNQVDRQKCGQKDQGKIIRHEKFKLSMNINHHAQEYSCNGPQAFKSQRVGHQSNQKQLHHYQHPRYQLNSYINSKDTADFWVP